MMIRTLRALLFTVLVLTLGAGAAQARDERYPKTTEPAFTLTYPDDWTRANVQNSLSLVSPDHRIAFTFAVTAADVSMDKMFDDAVKTLHGTLIGKKDVSLSGYSGSAATWSYVNARGVKLNVTTTVVKIVRVGAFYATYSRLEVDANTAVHHQLADTVERSVKIVPAGNGK